MQTAVRGMHWPHLSCAIATCDSGLPAGAPPHCRPDPHWPGRLDRPREAFQCDKCWLSETSIGVRR